MPVPCPLAGADADSEQATSCWDADGRVASRRPRSSPLATTDSSSATTVAAPKVREGHPPDICVAHLRRRWDKMGADLPHGRRHVPRNVRNTLEEALDAKDLPADEIAEVIADLTERVEMLHDDAHPDDARRRIAARLRAERESLSTVLKTREVNATNWAAEQATTPGVVTDTVWGDDRALRGAETQRRIMSVLRTDANQRVDPSAYPHLAYPRAIPLQLYQH